MEQHGHSPKTGSKTEPFYKSLPVNAWISLALISGITLFYLLTRHQKHVSDVLPYVLIVAVMLMHVFMHGRHGGHGHGGKRRG